MHKPVFKDIYKRLENDLPSYLFYHDAAHTKTVVNQARFIAEKEGLSSEDIGLIEIASLFHDTGFLFQAEGHEEKSCELALKELPQYSFSEIQIEKICGMIKATKIPQKPKNTNEKIVADADLFYLGTSRYNFFSGKLYKELKFLKPEITDREWFNIQVDFLRSHTFHTPFAIKVLEPVKQQNLQELLNSDN
ncbi:HD domain-containing protein [Gramella jeungdoensis]|uniref:HD domain-containing protein n=1 Tax=Gramella jeungdoensis TaxID=708091 RepID=A0ABT0YWZ9_9FLAO|nr:HD domain-containing protein [Gramella jeungdoensis]MCM8567979.1 HD domain-containing protein [Gramella jeungdoensis]